MVTQLLEHERIQTTLPKAKELRKVADRVVTYAKKVRALTMAACNCNGKLQVLFSWFRRVQCNSRCV
jgi:ribosomal protein L17